MDAQQPSALCFVFLTDHADIDLSGARSLDELLASTRAAIPIAQPAHLSLAASNGQSYESGPGLVRSFAA